MVEPIALISTRPDPCVTMFNSRPARGINVPNVATQTGAKLGGPVAQAHRRAFRGSSGRHLSEPAFVTKARPLRRVRKEKRAPDGGQGNRTRFEQRLSAPHQPTAKYGRMLHAARPAGTTSWRIPSAPHKPATEFDAVVWRACSATAARTVSPFSGMARVSSRASAKATRLAPVRARAGSPGQVILKQCSTFDLEADPERHKLE